MNSHNKTPVNLALQAINVSSNSNDTYLDALYDFTCSENM